MTAGKYSPCQHTDPKFWSRSHDLHRMQTQRMNKSALGVSTDGRAFGTSATLKQDVKIMLLPIYLPLLVRFLIKPIVLSR
jgi:hypothetical protein